MIIIASVFAAQGYTPIINQNLSINTSVTNNKTSKNFGLLSSTPIYKTPVRAKNRKALLKVFNSKENVYGEKVRFICMHSILDF